MKHKASITQTYLKRDREAIPHLFRVAKSLAPYPTTTKQLFEIAASLPCDQYYISDDAALSYFRNRRFHNRVVRFKNPFKQRLFDAFYDEVTSMMAQDRYKGVSVRDAVICSLSRPAPCIGLTPFVMYRTFIRQAKKRQNHKP